MPRTIRLTVILVAAALGFPGLPRAQTPVQQRRPTTVLAITIPDQPGAPFSATLVVEFERFWPDGTSEIRRTIDLIARDSQGRTHNETRRLMPQYFHGSPELTSVRLFDPVTRQRTTYDPAVHAARQQFVPRQPRPISPLDPAIHIQDLGVTMLNGLEARGTRRSVTFLDYENGTGEPIEIVDEVWYSEDLHLDLLVRHSDPRLGVQTLGVSNLKRTEPPPSMFQAPPGYRILTIPPAAALPQNLVGRPDSDPPS